MESDPCFQLEIRLYKFAKIVDKIAEGKEDVAAIGGKVQEETIYEKIMRKRGCPVVLRKKETEIVEIDSNIRDDFKLDSRPTSAPSSSTSDPGDEITEEPMDEIRPKSAPDIEKGNMI